MSAACDCAQVESVFVVAISSRSPDLSPCDFFLWGYVKGLVFILPLPANIEEMKERITAALETLLKTCYSEFGTSSNTDLTSAVTDGAHIEYLWKSVVEPTNICTFLCKFSQ